jgi:tRNA (mo5U34)-methyltransferase
MINNFIKKCAQSKLSSICDELLDTSKQAMTVNNGNIAKWESAIDELKTHNKGRVNYQPPYLNIEILNSDTKLTQQSLKKLTPWRKGPYQIGGLKLDSEWRGDMKWDRLKNHIQPLKGKTVLDVGSGNGYFTYLMALSGAQIALGIEPFLLFNYQFMSIHTLINNPPSAFCAFWHNGLWE